MGMPARLNRVSLVVLAFALAACAPKPRQVTGNFNPSPVKQVTAEANQTSCSGGPKNVAFQVTITLRIIPANAELATLGMVELVGDHKSDFEVTGRPPIIKDNQVETFDLTFKPADVGPRYATLVLKLPSSVTANREIRVHLVGLATCINASGSIGDKDGDGLTDSHDPAVANADQDGDGIPDGREDKNFNGVVDRETETDPTKKDTDGDGRNDGDEDVNKNGKVDEGEGDPKDPNH